MLAIGEIITDASGRSFRLVGIEPGTGRWVAQAVDFGAPFVVGAETLRDEFGVADATEDEPPAVDEQAGWEALAAQERASQKNRRPDDRPSPEDVFHPERETVDYGERVSGTRKK